MQWITNEKQGKYRAYMKELQNFIEGYVISHWQTETVNTFLGGQTHHRSVIPSKIHIQM